MSKKFLVPIDLNQLELQNVALQNLATAPASPVVGQVYYNTAQNKAFVWNGTSWVPWEVSAGNVTGVKGNAEGSYRMGNVNLTPANIGAVPTSRTVNGHALSSNVTITASDIGVEAGAEVNVQANWTEASSTSDAYIKNKPTLGTASAKGVDSTITSGSTSTNLPTSQAVAAFVSTELSAVDAMRFKGTIGTGGTVSTLPTSGVKVGDTYRVITAGTYAGQVCEVGDLIIATATTPTWTVAQTNIDGAITSISGTSPVSVTGSGSSRTVAVSYTSVTGKPTANQTPSFGSTFTISQISQSATGQITATDRTVKIPNTLASTSANGLMSSADKNKLDSMPVHTQATIAHGTTSQNVSYAALAYRAYDATTLEEVVIDSSVDWSLYETTFTIASANAHDIVIDIVAEAM